MGSWINCSRRSSRPKRKGPAWAWPSRAALSKRTAGRSRRKTARQDGALFTICLPEACRDKIAGRLKTSHLRGGGMRFSVSDGQVDTAGWDQGPMSYLCLAA